MRKKMQTHEQPMVVANDDGFIEPPITDNFGRIFDYLRLAVNDQCNLRCIYCMPEKGIPFLDKNKLLNTKDVKRLINIFSSLGVSKIRFTGGEPLLRKDIFELIQYSSELPEIDTVHMTTNGVLLPSYLNQLERAGLSGLNISLDTLRPDRFKSITRRGHFQDVMKGLDMAFSSRIHSIKVNVVTMKEFNDDEILDFVELTRENDIIVRFIELMPFDSHQIWKTGKFYSAEKIIGHLEKNIKGLRPSSGSKTEHHAFEIDGYKGKVAVIPAFTRSLCNNCNRIRITADGKLLNCLYSRSETDLLREMINGSSDGDIKDLIRESMRNKLMDGWLSQRDGKDQRESMTQIGG